MSLLNRTQLPKLHPSVLKPTDAMMATSAGILHLGVGAFHRSHQALYTEDAINEAGGSWRIIGAGMTSPVTTQRMQAQDCL